MKKFTTNKYFSNCLIVLILILILEYPGNILYPYPLKDKLLENILYKNTKDIANKDIILILILIKKVISFVSYTEDEETRLLRLSLLIDKLHPSPAGPT